MIKNHAMTDGSGVAVAPDFLYGTAWKEERTQALVELAVQQGFRGFDTANQRRHYFEEGVGLALVAAYRTGTVVRQDIFLQTKYTYRNGQDHRLPYDPEASPSSQVAQSMASSLKHLKTDYVDSYVLHGPAFDAGWADVDAEVWAAMGDERDAGRTRYLGVSNVSLTHLEQMLGSGAEPPAFVQNRCYASTGWDRQVRAFCRDRKIIYQGFSLLTANSGVLTHPWTRDLAKRLSATPEQVVFQFSRAVGMLPLTGTTNAIHMTEDLGSLVLDAQAIEAIESLTG